MIYLASKDANFIVRSNGVLFYTKCLPILYNGKWFDFLGTGKEVNEKLPEHDCKIIKKSLEDLKCMEKYTFDVSKNQLRIDIKQGDEVQEFCISKSEMDVLDRYYQNRYKLLIVTKNGTAALVSKDDAEDFGLCESYNENYINEITTGRIAHGLNVAKMNIKFSFTFDKIVNEEAVFTPQIINIEFICNGINRTTGALSENHMRVLKEIIRQGVREDIFIGNPIEYCSFGLEPPKINADEIIFTDTEFNNSDVYLMSKNKKTVISNDRIYLGLHCNCIEIKSFSIPIEKFHKMQARMAYGEENVLAIDPEVGSRLYIEHLFSTSSKTFSEELENMIQELKESDILEIDVEELVVLNKRCTFVGINKIKSYMTLPENPLAIMKKIEVDKEKNIYITLDFKDTEKHNSFLNPGGKTFNKRYKILFYPNCQISVLKNGVEILTEYNDEYQQRSFVEYVED